jgi:predicted nuclease with TOPRIM domain
VAIDREGFEQWDPQSIQEDPFGYIRELETEIISLDESVDYLRDSNEHLRNYIDELTDYRARAEEAERKLRILQLELSPAEKEFRQETIRQNRFMWDWYGLFDEQECQELQRIHGKCHTLECEGLRWCPYLTHP